MRSMFLERTKATMIYLTSSEEAMKTSYLAMVTVARGVLDK